MKEAKKEYEVVYGPVGKGPLWSKVFVGYSAHDAERQFLHSTCSVRNGVPNVSYGVWEMPIDWSYATDF